MHDKELQKPKEKEWWPMADEYALRLHNTNNAVHLC